MTYIVGNAGLVWCKSVKVQYVEFPFLATVFVRFCSHYQMLLGSHDFISVTRCGVTTALFLNLRVTIMHKAFYTGLNSRRFSLFSWSEDKCYETWRVSTCMIFLLSCSLFICFILLSGFFSTQPNFPYPSCEFTTFSIFCLLQFVLFLLPPSSLRRWVLPDTGVRSPTVVSDGVMSHASILKASLINWLLDWVTEQTNFAPAENPLVISINTETRMDACKHTQWNRDEDRYVLKDRRKVSSLFRINFTKQN